MDVHTVQPRLWIKNIEIFAEYLLVFMNKTTKDEQIFDFLSLKFLFF